jgi:hypothetical protein
VESSDAWLEDCAFNYRQANLPDVAYTLVEQLAWERQQRQAVEAQAAAMREAIGVELNVRWRGAAGAAGCGLPYLVSARCAALQDAISGDAGRELLERLRLAEHRVERLRGFALAAREMLYMSGLVPCGEELPAVGLLGPTSDFDVSEAALQPGDLEE